MAKPAEVGSSSSATKASSGKGDKEARPLAPDFKPTDLDVICARGKKSFNHPGNKRLRALISDKLNDYSKTNNKLEKTMIVSRVIETVRLASPNGGFVKEEKGQWFEVGEHLAREKVGQSFRDMLHTKYKSSTKSKKVSRRAHQDMLEDEVDYILQTNKDLQGRMEEMSEASKRNASDEQMEEMFQKTNEFLLQTLKNPR